MGSEKGGKRTGLLIAILSAVTAVAVCITIWAVFLREKDNGTILAPDYVPTEDQNAETIPGDSGEKMEQPEDGGSISLSYAKEVTVDLSEGTADLYFANPGKSNLDMVLQIVIQDTVIAQSGALKPGNQVTLLELPENMAKKLSAGVYEGLFNVLLYHPETGEKAIVNTEIPITITVNE